MDVRAPPYSDEGNQHQQQGLPKKRHADVHDDVCGASFLYAVPTPQKSAKRNAPDEEETSSSSTDVGPSSPGLSDTFSADSEDRECSASLGEDIRHQREHLRQSCILETAMRLFRDSWKAFLVEYDVGNADQDTRENRAAKICEAIIAERQEELKCALLHLLPWFGSLQHEEGHSPKYQVLELQGRQPPRHLTKNLQDAELLEAQLKWFRTQPRGRVEEALCAVLAAMSTRKEKCWLEAHDRQELETKLGPKTRVAGESARRKDIISRYVDEACSSGCGFFSHYLVHPYSHLRVSFSFAEPKPTPSCLVATSRLPLWDALASLDDAGPLRGDAACRSWCLQSGRQFAFQLANTGLCESSPSSRANVKTLKPDPRLRKLLCSKKPVVLLEAVAALASRDVAKSKGLGEIVQAELTSIMHEAKSRGEAVVFHLGSDRPHALAEKVYLKKPISDYGLKCGYLRWRASPKESWARERAWTDRVCLCLQMP